MKLPPYSPKLAHGDPVARHLLRTLGPPHGMGLCAVVTLATSVSITQPKVDALVRTLRGDGVRVYDGLALGAELRLDWAEVSSGHA